VLLLSSSPSRFRTFRAPPKGGACAPSRGRRGLVPVVRRRGTAWRSGIPTRPPVLKISRGSPARSFTPTGAVGGSLQGVGPIVPARGGGEAGKLQRPDLPYTLPTLYLAVRDEPRPCPTTYPTADLPTLHLPYTWAEPRPCPAAYPTPTLYLAVRGEPRPCPTAYPILRPTQTSPACPPLPTLRRFPAAKSQPPPPGLPYKTEPPAEVEASPRRRDQVQPAHPEPTLQNQPARAFETLSPGTLSPLPLHPPAGAGKS
jgi:hypothetical protein